MSEIRIAGISAGIRPVGTDNTCLVRVDTESFIYGEPVQLIGGRR